MILLKSVLSSIPVYQNTILLAPKSFISKVDALLRRFLWEGGKNNERRLHLVSWDKIKKPILEGGLQVRNIAVQNLDLGSKLLWNLVSGHTSWSKKVLWKKYFQGSHSRCLDKPPRTLTESPIFKLCLTALERFKSNL